MLIEGEHRRLPYSSRRDPNPCMGANSTKKPENPEQPKQQPDQQPKQNDDQQASRSCSSAAGSLIRRKESRRGSCVSGTQKEISWTWSGPAGDHSPYPVDNIPYQGPEILYCFVDVLARFQIMKNQINLGPSAVTTNVEHYLQEITDCYKEGFTLDKFVRIPGVKMTTEITDWSVYQPYQAILSQTLNKPNEASDIKEDWELTVEKRILSTRTLAFDETDHENDLLNTIHRYASAGARLTCAEPVGYVRSESTNQQYGIMGVELFFNVPRHHVDTYYTYHTVTIPAMYHIIPDDTQSLQQVVCDADFFGQLKLFLDSGWRLVDICMDSSAIADAYKIRATSKRVETIWIFEKETEKLCDETPVYEGVLIEYLHKVKVTIEGERPSRDWRPVIAGMGQSGWELATVIQTPLLVQSSFTTYTMKLLFVFQRPLTPYQLFTKYGITVLPGGDGLNRGRGRGGFGSGSGTPLGGAGRGAVGGRAVFANHQPPSRNSNTKHKTSNGALMSGGNHVAMNGHVTMKSDVTSSTNPSFLDGAVNRSFGTSNKSPANFVCAGDKDVDNKQKVETKEDGFTISQHSNNGSRKIPHIRESQGERKFTNPPIQGRVYQNDARKKGADNSEQKAVSHNEEKREHYVKRSEKPSSHRVRNDVNGEGTVLDDVPKACREVNQNAAVHKEPSRMYYYRTQRIMNPEKWTLGNEDDDNDDKENDDDDDDDYPNVNYSTNGWSTKSSSSENGQADFGKRSVFAPIGIPLT